MLITAVVTLFSTSFIKPYFDGSKNAAKPTTAIQAPANQSPYVQSAGAQQVIRYRFTSVSTSLEQAG